MLVKQSKLPLDGIATTNYFQALQTMEVRFESTDLTEDPTLGVHHQALPLGVKRPDALQTSTESAFFVEKHHTKIKKATRASFVPEVAEAMLSDDKTALLSLLPDCFDAANSKVGSMCKLLKTPRTPTTLPRKRSSVLLPSKTSTPAIEELSHASKALGMFELKLMSIAPVSFSNDHWIQYITGQPVEWIPAHHARLLHPNTLLRLLWSKLGAHCMQQWKEVQWQGHLRDKLEALQQLEGFYPEDSSVLRLHAVYGGASMLASALAARC
uniref:Uncharacterized protein n=1 Tax=Peronospora matthiolae TaxID=2874970 RepID=A0AAV1UDM2_9STRA